MFTVHQTQFTNNKQFSTHLTVNGRQIETVKEIKLLGTIISDDLKWNKNTKFLVKRAYARMELLRQLNNFTKSIKDKLHIYKTYIRSVVEQSCIVWGSSLTRKNKNEIERVQKVAVKIILKNTKPYKETLKYLNIETLEERRQILSNRFADRCIKNKRTMDMFEIRTKAHKMKLRTKINFKTQKANTVRMQKSAIPDMTNYLNNKKSRIRETPTLSTDADRRTDTNLKRLRDLSNFLIF